MPRLRDETMEVGTVKGMQAFQFSFTKIDTLGATEYTLATLLLDGTGSVLGYEDEIKKVAQAAIESLKKSPRSANMLVRVGIFSTSYRGGVEEIHGFKPLHDIDPASYPDIRPNGMTPLYDAAFSAVGATNAYAKQLMDQDFQVNGIVIIVTDGDNNDSKATTQMVKREIDRGVRGEEVESLVAILVGINAQLYSDKLDRFANDVGMKYIDAGDASRQKLAKLAGFVSQSVSSQSQSLGTGGPSQNIAATI